MVTPNSTVKALGKRNFFAAVGALALFVGSGPAAFGARTLFVVSMALPLSHRPSSASLTEPPARGSVEVPMGPMARDLRPSTSRHPRPEAGTTEIREGDMNLHVDSEVGRLRQAILHRPDLELKRLTPTNHDEYLFDDVLWVKHAKQEHDAFADALRDRGVRVHMLDRLLTDTLAIPEARKHVVEATLDERVYGPMALDALHDLLIGMEASELTTCLIGGMTKRELLDQVEEPSSVVVQALG